MGEDLWYEKTTATLHKMKSIIKFLIYLGVANSALSAFTFWEAPAYHRFFVIMANLYTIPLNLQTLKHFNLLLPRNG